MTVVTLLTQPFPYNNHWQNRLRMSAFFGGFVFLFLLLFRPFGMDTASWREALFYSFVYGMVCLVTVFSGTTLIPLLAPSFFTEARWTSGRQLLFVWLIVFLVGCANYFTSVFLWQSGWNLRQWLWFQGISLAVSLPPLFVLTLVRQGQLVKRYREQASGLEQKLQQKLAWQETQQPAQPLAVVPEQQSVPTPATPAAEITISGDYQNESLTIAVDRLYLVESANNYVKVYFEDKGKVVYSIIRLTMKRAEELLEPYTVFFRCHRTCIVNLDKVAHVEGNAQGYKMKLPGIEEGIPVSRSLSSEFTDRLLAVRKEVSL